VSKIQRNSARHRVALRVKYWAAKEFVVEYAENLSNGGMFIKGAEHLRPLDAVSVEVTLPGFGTFAVKGEVAHVMTSEQATMYQRTAGAGIAITKAPPDFQDALSRYLQRLGSRADKAVLVVEERLRNLLSHTGYHVGPAPEPAGLASAMVRSEYPVVALIVPPDMAARYAAEAAAAGAGNVVIPMSSEKELPTVLERLDAEL
jgi:Tfp pilus assembly protein PilZ